MYIETDIERLEQLLEAEQIAEIYKDVPKRFTIKDELQALREKWNTKEYTNQTAHSTAMKRRDGSYSLADERMDRKYERGLNIMRAKNEAFLYYGFSVLLCILVLLS